MTSELVFHAELLDKIKHHSVNAPRSLQKELGPSEVGDPCERKLAYKMFNVEPPMRPPSRNNDMWKANVGTAIHTYLEDVYGNDPDFYTERRVTVGAWFDGERARVLQGSTDLYHIPSGTVIDFKTTSVSMMEDYARGKLPEVYRTQIHLYGLGYANDGFDVRRVALLFLPRDNDLNLSTSVLHIEDFDPTIAREGLARLESIALRSKDGDFASLATASSYCTRCPWFVSGAKKPNEGRCPGVFVQRGLDVDNPFGI